MDRNRRTLLSLAIGLATSPLAGFAAADSKNRLIAGTWSAFLDRDSPPTRLKLVIDESGVGHLTVIDLGEVPVPVRRLDIAGNRLRLDIDKPPLTYEAVFDGAKINGTLKRGNEEFPLAFFRGDFYSEPKLVEFPPAPLSAQRLHDLRRMARAPAMGVGWQFRDAPRHVLVDGKRAIDADAVVTRHDQWHLGSITKSMTATLAARIVESGALDWHARIGEVLRDAIGETLPAYRDVTLLHVLSHRGGLVRDVEPVPERRVDYVRVALNTPPTAAVGAQMLYSNADYVVAGLVLEVVMKKPWEELIATHVFEPLGLTSFGFGPPGSGRSLDQPQGHEPAPRGIRPTRFDIPEAMAPAGRVHMSMDDLLVYLAAHRDRPSKFLSEASWNILHTPPFGGDYALGWSVSPNGVLSHGGTNQKWKAEVLVDRSNRLVVCSAANVLNNNTQSALLQLLASARLSH